MVRGHGGMSSRCSRYRRYWNDGAGLGRASLPVLASRLDDQDEEDDLPDQIARAVHWTGAVHREGAVRSRERQAVDEARGDKAGSVNTMPSGRSTRLGEWEQALDGWDEAWI